MISRFSVFGVTAMAILSCSNTVPDPGFKDLTTEPQRVTYVDVTSLEDRIRRFLVAHGASEDIAREMAPLFARNKYPRIMASIAVEKTTCDPHAVGAAGEVSMFQILRWPGGDPTDNAHALSVAIGHLEEKIRITGSLWPAVRAYNGSGAQAEKYRNKIKGLVSKI